MTLLYATRTLPEEARFPYASRNLRVYSIGVAPSASTLALVVVRLVACRVLPSGQRVDALLLVQYVFRA